MPVPLLPPSSSAMWWSALPRPARTNLAATPPQLAGAWLTENHSLRNQGWWLSGRQARLLMRDGRAAPPIHSLLRSGPSRPRSKLSSSRLRSKCSHSSSSRWIIRSGRGQLKQPGGKQLDHAACVVARVVIDANAQAANATHQFVGIEVRADLAGLRGSIEELSAHRHEAVEKVGVQGIEAGVVGLHNRGESVLGDQEINEEVYPSRQRSVRRDAACQQGRTGLGAGFDLVSVDGDDEVCSRREVAVDCAHPHAGPCCDVADPRLPAGGDGNGGGGGEAGLLRSPPRGPVSPRPLARSP